MSAKNQPRQPISSNQKGMISIMTTMVLMIVISLIVLGFSQIARRNQRESLDRQLSTQAFYAAETGVNDVRELMRNAINNGNTVPDKTGCTDTGVGGFYAALDPDIDPAKGIKYSCLLVDPSPTELNYTIGSVSSVVPLISGNGSNFNSVTLEWESKATGNPMTGCPANATNVFVAKTNWACGYGVLRFDFVPTAGNFNADTLQNNTMTAFAVPVTAGGTATRAYAPGSANGNSRFGASCNATRCTLTINGLNQNAYHMRVSSIYKDVDLKITATRAGGGAAELSGAQAVIDSTGRAQDVLRRIQVNVPLRPTSKNELSDFAIQSTDAICKRYTVMNGYFDNTVTGVTSTNRLCQP